MGRLRLRLRDLNEPEFVFSTGEPLEGPRRLMATGLSLRLVRPFIRRQGLYLALSAQESRRRHRHSRPAPSCRIRPAHSSGR